MKNYQKWSKIKSAIHNGDSRPCSYDVGQIWWCSIGENIGIETDGKGNRYLRPVLIIKKFGYQGFLGLPLTSRSKPDKPFYSAINFNGRKSYILLSQVRTWDASRLLRKMGEIDAEIFENVKRKLGEYLEITEKIQS